MEVFCSLIITQSLPGFKDFLGGALTQSLYIREKLYPFFVIRQNSLDSGLLEHDFRNPDFVGIMGFSPGELPVVILIPEKKSSSKISYSSIST